MATRKGGKGSEFSIVRKRPYGEDSIGGGFTDFNPIQKIIYGAGKRDFRINNFLLQLQEKDILLSPPVKKNSLTLGISYERMNGLNYTGYLPEMKTEADVEKCVNLMLEFLEGTAFPLLDKFEDLRELDKMINGNAPWDTDIQKPYTFVGNFAEKRLIVAKLSGNPNFNVLVDFTFISLERLSAEAGHRFVYDRNDVSKPLPALIEILKDVEPIY
jgi:hypothetical protein